MTHPTNNPTSDQDPNDAAPSQALRVVRLVIVLGLLVGIAVFMVFAIEELKAGSRTYTQPNGFGALDAASALDPANAPSQSANPLAGLTTPDPSKFITILRKNPHPGEIVPFMDAAAFGQPPYRQPSAGNEVWEFCVYRSQDASMTELIAYYQQQAETRGMRLLKQKPTSANMPGGVATSWSDGQAGLQVTVRPLPLTEPTRPPLAPRTPLEWVVKYSYPETTPAP